MFDHEHYHYSSINGVHSQSRAQSCSLHFIGNLMGKKNDSHMFAVTFWASSVFFNVTLNSLYWFSFTYPINSLQNDFFSAKPVLFDFMYKIILYLLIWHHTDNILIYYQNFYVLRGQKWQNPGIQLETETQSPPSGSWNISLSAERRPQL